jgi:pyrimidine operon attenuation protein/uracil phosphoribosyltransferase
MPMRQVLDSSDITRTTRRIAHEILEGTPDVSSLVLLGIPTRGAALANRLAEHIQEISGQPVDVGVLDVTMYRDDVGQGVLRTPRPSAIPAAGVDGRTVVLVDDVLYSGRTARASLDALVDIGRPRVVRLAVLVDRGHREFPIRADYVGKNIPSQTDDHVRVKLQEIDGEDGVVMTP